MTLTPPVSDSGKNSPATRPSTSHQRLPVAVSNHQYSEINRARGQSRPGSRTKPHGSPDDEGFNDDDSLSPPPLPVRHVLEPDISMETCLKSDTPPVGTPDTPGERRRQRRQSLVEERSYSPRQMTTEFLSENSEPEDAKSQLRSQSIELDRLQESLLETLESIKAIDEPENVQCTQAVEAAGAGHQASLSSSNRGSPSLVGGEERHQSMWARPLPTPPDKKTFALRMSNVSETETELPLARNSMQLDLSHAPRLAKPGMSHYEMLKTPTSLWADGQVAVDGAAASTAQQPNSPPYAQARIISMPPGVGNDRALPTAVAAPDPSALVVEVFQDSSDEEHLLHRSNTSISASNESLSVQRASITQLLDSPTSERQSISQLSSSPLQSPGRASIFLSRERANEPVVHSSTLELWMVAWMREYLGVEPEDVDVYQLTSTSTSTSTDVPDGPGKGTACCSH